MKPRILLLIGILFFSTFTADAQVRGWLNKQKKKLEKNEYVQKTQKAVKQIDPKEYVKRKINENYYLSEYVNNLNYKYTQLKTTLHNNVNLYNNSDNKFQEGFYKTNNVNEKLSLLNEGVINLKYPTSVSLSGVNYQLFNNNNHIIALAENKMPINQNLEKIIETAYWSSQTKNLNSSYISNLKSLASLNSEFYGYLLMFYDASLKIFDNLNGIGYGGISATSLIDEYSSMLGYGFSISGTASSFKSYRSELKDMQDLSKRIYNNSNTFLTVKDKLIQTKNADYTDVENSLNAFKTISNDINTLANQIAEQKKAISVTRQELSKLSNFYGISFIESIGDLYKYLEDYYSLIEEGTRKHSENLNNYVNDINTESNLLYVNSKKYFDEISNTQIKDELTYLNDYISIQKDLTNSEFKNISNDKYILYLNKINQLNSTLIKSKELDFIEFYNIKSELKDLYENFPVKDAQNYYASILRLIDNKQIIGGKYFETYSSVIMSNVASTLDDKSKAKSLVKSGQDLDEYYQKAKSNNIIFFSVIAGILILSILILILIMRKKKRAKV